MNKHAEIPSKYVGRYRTYPETTGKRQAEGGRRLSGEQRASRADAPLVTVITVCWNSARTIEQAMLSVFGQSYDNIEYVIVDGGSTDATVDLLHKHESRIDYFVSEPDDGLYYAMNKGLELAKGDYILILNSDDWYTPDCVDSLLSAYKESTADFVSALAYYVDSSGKIIRSQPSFPLDEGVFFRMPLRHETMLIPAKLYEQFGPYDTGLRVSADRELTTKLFIHGIKHFELKKHVMYFTDTGVSSTDIDKVLRDRVTLLGRYFPFLSTEEKNHISDLQTLTPQKLMDIVFSHKDDFFTRSAFSYAHDRKSRSRNGEWASVNIDILNSLLESGAHPEDKMASLPHPIRAATFSTRDDGGAGTGSQRRVAALRSAGVDAHIHCVFQKSLHRHVHKVPLLGAATMPDDIWRVWSEKAVLKRTEHPQLQARELFSKIGTVVDFRDLTSVFDQADIVHLHWIVGMFDYEHAHILADKPVVWTLADMNAFTGGCHYSESCTEYRSECKRCPLLADGSTFAHEAWKTKRTAYAQIKNLHIICPSQWLADCARESSLFGDRTIHVVPNALPVDRFIPTSRLVARLALGLPLDRKLVLFGADSLTNKRKGGDILVESVRHLKKMELAENVEGVFFGANSLDLGVKTHNMGHVSDEKKMSQIYAAADVFAFPSREDNAPLTVVESMLSGTPVVGFPVGNVPELITHKETGYIARYTDPIDFADGLAWALRDIDSADTLKRRMHVCLKARAHNDPDTAVVRHLTVYAEMLKDSESYHNAVALRHDLEAASKKTTLRRPVHG